MSRLKVSLRKGAYQPDRSPSSAPWPTAPCSARLDEVRAAQFAGEVEAKIRQDEATLETHLERLAFREIADDGPGTFAAVRANPLFARARSRVDALAAIVGVEAWSQGRRSSSSARKLLPDDRAGLLSSSTNAIRATFNWGASRKYMG
jgi:hypothetical protein